jgi:hypothetical protein
MALAVVQTIQALAPMVALLLGMEVVGLVALTPQAKARVDQAVLALKV